MDAKFALAKINEHIAVVEIGARDVLDKGYRIEAYNKITDSDPDIDTVVFRDKKGTTRVMKRGELVRASSEECRRLIIAVNSVRSELLDDEPPAVYPPGGQFPGGGVTPPDTTVTEKAAELDKILSEDDETQFYGWICPRCQTVWSPHKSQCDPCS